MTPDSKETSSPDAGSQCRRCGTCCRKGGPALHYPDAQRVRTGAIEPSALVTLREGERVHDNVHGGIITVDTDVIKIQSRPDGLVCGFFDEARSACRIYDHRPLECRALRCWDTAEIERIYAVDRLTRRDLFGEISWLWELIETHQERCHPGRLTSDIDAGELSEIIAYDAHLRRLTAERTRVHVDWLPLIFGRPLPEIRRGALAGLSGQRAAVSDRAAP